MFQMKRKGWLASGKRVSGVWLICRSYCKIIVMQWASTVGTQCYVNIFERWLSFQNVNILILSRLGDLLAKYFHEIGTCVAGCSCIDCHKSPISVHCVCLVQGGVPLLCDVAQQGDVDAVITLLQSGANCNAQNQVSLLSPVYCELFTVYHTCLL